MFDAQSPAELDAILKSDGEIRALYQRHQELDRQVIDAELGVKPVDDTTLARLKREKLRAKDRLTRLCGSAAGS
ncbi:YdcH family protein [Coralloluteibacterium thermophilus]|uniref:YdcH family protein n=1 Tax=Coralloluteibacterium thermophilum TaxID=2707049 RepID=A0ABV9NHU4_9GAMM